MRFAVEIVVRLALLFLFVVGEKKAGTRPVKARELKP